MTAHTARKVLKKYMQAGCVEKYGEKYCPASLQLCRFSGYGHCSSKDCCYAFICQLQTPYLCPT